MRAADLEGGSKLVSISDPELLAKYASTYEGLYTDVSYDFSRLMMMPLLRVVYPPQEVKEAAEQAEEELQEVQKALNKVHEAMTSETKFEEVKGSTTGQFFSHPCADAMTAVTDSVFRLFPKMFVSAHEEKQFQASVASFPKIVGGFLVKEKKDKVKFEVAQGTF